MNRGFIKNILAIAVLLTVVFFSQQPYLRDSGRSLYSQCNQYLAKARDWVYVTIYPKVRSEAEKRGEVVSQEFEKQKNNFFQDIWEKIKNYFAKIFSKTFGTDVK